MKALTTGITALNVLSAAANFAIGNFFLAWLSVGAAAWLIYTDAK